MGCSLSRITPRFYSPPLSTLLGESKEVSEPAAEALVNLSQNSDVASKMIVMGMIAKVMDFLYKSNSSISSLLVMLLVNLTQLDAAISALLQSEDEKFHGLYMMKLGRSFCTSFDGKNGVSFSST
ncbi:hypothetical protein RJ641_012538 [Dillenia turbinata]|uniref:Protein HGH1 homolog n=1 Tax=Dillenia turbinata TaxID=194707 RepID=A0AAN8V2C3_9MAGN